MAVKTITMRKYFYKNDSDSDVTEKCCCAAFDVSNFTFAHT